MSKYELMYIIDASLEEAPRKELIERISTLIADHAGTVEKIDEWGKRRLAYPINYKNEGYYVLVNFVSAPDLPKEIERVLQISEDVLRYLIIKLEEKHTSVKPRPAPVRPIFARPAGDAAPMASAAADEAPARDEAPVQGEAPVQDETPVQDEAPQDEAPAVEPEEAAASEPQA